METPFLWPPDILLAQLPRFAKILNMDIVCSDAVLATLFCLFRQVISNSSDQETKDLREILESASSAIPPTDAKRGVVRPFISSLFASQEPQRRLYRSYKLLAQRLCVHREPHHRIIKEIASLSGSVKPETVSTILGIESGTTSLTYAALMFCLGDIEKAVSTLVEFNELDDTDTTKDLLNSIKKVLTIRANLRKSYLSRYRERDKDIAGLCEELGKNLKNLSLLLMSSDPKIRAEKVISLVKSNLQEPIGNIIEPIVSKIEKSGIEVYHDRSNEEALEEKYVLIDPLLTHSLIQSIATNVCNHSPSDLVRNASLSCSIGDRTRCIITITNETEDSESDRKFEFGRDKLRIQEALRKYGGDIRGSLRGRAFLTELDLQII